MRFHHICILVSNLDRAIKMWTEVFDFELQGKFVGPDEDKGGSDTKLSELMEDIWGMKGPKTTVALLTSPGGAMLELQESINPPMQQTPAENFKYFKTNVMEVGFWVDDVDYWWDRVRAAGYKTQTDYVWSMGEARTFLFYDDDHHLIQLWQGTGQQPAWQ
jgi:catechol 2,3-dioxygenase-like lactoylglutathione lyase family enzyme